MVASILSEAIIGIIIVLILFVFFFVIKKVLKLILVIVINSVLGVASIFLLNQYAGLQIPIAAYTLIPSALFGLPAVGTFVILRLFGIAIGVPVG